MQNKASLPPIKFLLDSPIDEGNGYPFPRTPTSSISTYAYHQRNLPSIKSADTDHLAAINAYNKKIMNFPTQDPYGSCNSLISPPESPGVKMVHQQQPSGSYNVRPSPLPSLPFSSSRQQYSCCAEPSSVHSAATSLENRQYFRQTEQNNSFAQTSSSRDHYSSTNTHIHPRLSITLLENMTFDDNSPSQGLYGQTLNDSSGGNRYQCPFCTKRFSRPSSLKIHTYSHTGEKPFVCTEPGCGRKFSVQSNMRRHLRVHRLGRSIK